MFKDMKLSTRLLLSFLSVGLLPFAIVAFMALDKASGSLSASAFNQLQSVREIKKTQIENFFAERKGDMGVLMETVDTLRKEAFEKLQAIQAIKKNQLEMYLKYRMTDVSALSTNNAIIKSLEVFEKAFMEDGNKTGGKLWKDINAEFGPWLEQYVKEYGYYDLFLIAQDGDVVYTAAKEPDLGQNLVKGELKDSSLGLCFQKAIKGTAIQDFMPYAPSNNEPAAFLGAPIKRGKETVGVVALQLSMERINRIMQERTGLGKTGETYLVGPDKRMRSDSFLDPQGHSVKASFAGTVEKNGVDTEAVRDALAGKTGTDVIIDYNGNPVLSAFAPLDIGGIHWVIIAEIDVAEAFVPVDGSGKEYYSKYIELYGYHDLFLINPDGYVFYSSAKEADYQTNMVNGKYNDSNLGKLVKKVLASREFEMADFAPYAPSNGEPEAFIAQPVIDKRDNELEIVVALQLSLKSINRIMQQREGMGETGETYLVGSDKLMRSDSFLDAQNHSVLASFKDPSKGKVDTEGSREALAGQTGRKIIIDYNGNPVLSAYTPVKVGDLTWALLAEIDEAEAFKSIHFLKKVILIIAVVGIVGIIFFALWSTRSITLFITAPIIRSVEGLTINSDNVASASKQLSRSSQELSSGATEQAASLEETSSALEEIAAQTRQNAGNAASSADAVKQVAGMVKQSAENAKIANNLACESRTVVEIGAKSMRELAEAMKGIRAGSEKITDIIEVINEITHQTKMLATNAAIEAARAGDQGKGFAVVADEVSKLAENSKNSAKEIAKLIKESSQQAQEGNQMAEKGRQVMSEILEKSIKVADLVSEISAAAEEQAHKMTEVNGMVESINTASSEQANGVDQVTKAVTQMDTVTQRNAANAEESAAASEELSAQAEELKHIILDLRRIVGSENGNGHSRSQGKKKELLRVSPLKEGTREHGNSSDHEAASMSLSQLQESLRPRKQIKPARAESLVVNPSEEIPMRDDFKDF